MASVTNPATVDRGSKVSVTPDPIKSTEVFQHMPAERGATPNLSQTSTPRHSTRSTKLFLQFVHSIQKVNGLVTFCVCKLCSGNRTHSVSVLFQYGPVKHGLCGFLTFSVIPKFTLVTLKDKVNTIYMVWQIKIL